MQVWALGVAVVQVNFPCQLGTLGSSAHQYFVSTAAISPPELAPAFQERLVLTRSYHFTEYQQTQQAPQATAIAGAPFRFGSFNKPYKITPKYVACCANVLRRYSRNVLVMSLQRHPAQQNMRAQLLAAGLVNKLEWKQRVESKAEHLVQLSHADLVLDTFGVNAVWTALDVLWSGTPLLSMRGNKMASRASSSLLDSVGLSELVTGTIKEYEDAITVYLEDSV